MLAIVLIMSLILPVMAPGTFLPTEDSTQTPKYLVAERQPGLYAVLRIYSSVNPVLSYRTFLLQSGLKLNSDLCCFPDTTEQCIMGLEASPSPVSEGSVQNFE